MKSDGRHFAVPFLKLSFVCVQKFDREDAAYIYTQLLLAEQTRPYSRPSTKLRPGLVGENRGFEFSVSRNEESLEDFVSQVYTQFPEPY